MRPRGPFVLAAVALLLTVSAPLALDWDFRALATAAERGRAVDRLLAFLGSFASPDLSVGVLSRGVELSLETLAIALLGTALAALLGWPLATLASRCVVQEFDRDAGVRGAFVVREAARLLLDVLRGVPDFAWALVVYSVTGNGPLTGILAIGISNAGVLGKVYSELWDSVDPGRYAALRSTGASRLAVLLYGIQPLASRGMLSFTLMRTECAVRNASVIGLVGGGGIGKALFDGLSDGRYGTTATFLGFLLVLTASVDVAANLLRRQLRVDPNHPRAAVDTSLRGTLRRRVVGMAGVAGALIGSLLLLREGLVYVIDQELGRVEWAWIASEYGKLLQPSLEPAVWLSAASESFVPLALGWLATVGSVLLAAGLAFPGSVAFQLEPHRFTGEATRQTMRVRRAALVVAARGATLVMRGVPEVAWVLLLAHLFGLGVLAGLGGMVLHSAGVLARVFTEAIDNVPYRQLETTLTGSRAQTFLFAAVPASLPDWKTYAMFQLEVNVRLGVVLGIVGVGGLGDVFHTAMSASVWNLRHASVFLIAMVLLTVGLDRASRALDAHRISCGPV